MFASYRKRLEADLTRWVGEGLVSPQSATTIRTRLQQEAGGVKLPSVLGMLGGLLLASGVIAFVAANWQEIPRLGKLTGILAALAAALFVAARYERREAMRASDAAATAATLMFGAGVALVGQMYHLPADWPAGALLVGTGAFAVAALMRSDGALLVAFACLAAWLVGKHGWDLKDPSPWYPALYLPLLALAMGRSNRAVHHAAVLAGALWLVLIPNLAMMFGRNVGADIAYLLFLSVGFVGLGMLGQDGRLPPLFAACLPWGLIGFALALALQLFRVLDAGFGGSGAASAHVVAAGIAGLAATAAMAALLSDRRAGLILAAAMLTAMATSIVFWIGLGRILPGRILVAALVLGSACALVAAGSLTGLRRLTLAGTLAFGLAVLVLLYRTVGTLIDQSLFFLVGGVLLLAGGGLARRLLRRIAPVSGSAA